MCKIRSYRYTCGCFKDRTLSYCRKTVAHPSSRSPMCSGSPTVVINVDSQCPAHEYSDFEESWEQRISAARARHDFVRHSSLHSLGGDDYFGGNMSSDDDESDYISSTPGSWGGSPPIMDDFARAAQREAEQELQSLRTQYHYEQYTKWRPYVSSSSARSNPKHPKHRRRPNPKVNGDPSPLRNSARPEDWGCPEALYEEDDMYAPQLHRIGSDGPSDSGSDSSEGSFGGLCDLAKLQWTAGYHGDEGTAVLDDDDDMLPNWG